MEEAVFKPALPKKGYGARLRSMVSSSGYGIRRASSRSPMNAAVSRKEEGETREGMDERREEERRTGEERRTREREREREREKRKELKDMTSYLRLWCVRRCNYVRERRSRRVNAIEERE